MPLLPGWEERLGEVDATQGAAGAGFALPASAEFYAGRTVHVSTTAEAGGMAELACQRPLAWVGLDFEFKHDRPGVNIDRRQVAHDPRSIRPLLLSLALAEPAGDAGLLYNFVVDVRHPEVHPAVRSILSLPCTFVAHYAQAELFCLLKLGLPEPRILWDTWVHEKALCLGRNHKKYKLSSCKGASIRTPPLQLLSLVELQRLYQQFPASAGQAGVAALVATAFVNFGWWRNHHWG